MTLAGRSDCATSQDLVGRGLAGSGPARQGLFELVAASVNVKSGQCATGQGWVRRGMARTLLSWWRTRMFWPREARRGSAGQGLARQGLF
jgi:hypothetical protein